MYSGVRRKIRATTPPSKECQISRSRGTSCQGGSRALCASTCAWMGSSQRGRPNCRCPLLRRRRVGSASCRKAACIMFRHTAPLHPDTRTHHRSSARSARRPKWPAHLHDAIAAPSRDLLFPPKVFRLPCCAPGVLCPIPVRVGPRSGESARHA